MRVYAVRTDLDHLLIYVGRPVRHPEHGWPRPGKRRGDATCIERFCELSMVAMGWDWLPYNVPTEVRLFGHKESEMRQLIQFPSVQAVAGKFPDGAFDAYNDECLAAVRECKTVKAGVLFYAAQINQDLNASIDAGADLEQIRTSANAALAALEPIIWPAIQARTENKDID